MSNRHFTPFQQTLSHREYLFEPGCHSAVISIGPNGKRNGSKAQIEAVLLDKRVKYRFIGVETLEEYRNLGIKRMRVRWEILP